MSITFNNLNIKFKLKNINSIKKWIKITIKEEKFICGKISYIFTDNDSILELNKKYLSHHYITDIMTFDYTEKRSLSGDIFICINAVNDNAIKYKVEFLNELKRVIIHGILHLAGYKDKTKKEKGIMKSKEDYYLNLFEFNKNGI